ncbi:MAG: tetratricopeptide repeat protein [Candidatus Omnitrophota bacterium]
MKQKILIQRGDIFKIIIFFLLGLAIYSNTFHAAFHLDDGHNIIANSAIRNLWNLKAVWNFFPTRFFTYLSLALNYHFHRLSLPGYHVFNLAVHLGAAMLVSWLALLLLSVPAVKDSPVARHAKLISLLAGLMFVAHPIQTQAVTYIIQRTASLAAFFYLLSVCLYLKARLNQTRFARAGLPRSLPLFRNDSVYIGSVLAAVAALFTKESAVTLPFMLLLCEVFFFWNVPSHPYPPPQGGGVPFPKLWKGGVRGGGGIKRLAPFFFVLVIFMVVFYLTGSGRISEVRVLKEARSGLTAITPVQYLLTQFRVIVTYLRLLLVPVNQNFDYDYPIVQTLWQTPALASLVFILLILAAAVILFRKHRLLSFSIFWFFLVLVPESSILPIRDVIFEHRLYLPMVGYCLFLLIIFYYLFGDKKLKLMSLVLLVIVACYSVMTYARNQVWKDEITLWNDVVKKSPNKARPWSSRGLAYSRSGQYAQALADCNQAIKLNPTSGVPYCSRAVVYHYMAEYDLAIADYTWAIEFYPYPPDAYSNRGFSYEKKGEYDRALADWLRAVEFNPYDADAYFNRGRIFFQKGEYDRAIAEYSLTIKYNPRFAEAYFNRGNAYRHKEMYPAAFSDYNQALKIDPLYGEAYNNRAATLIVLGEYQRARKDIRKMEKLGYPLNPALRKFLPEPDN